MRALLLAFGISSVSTAFSQTPSLAEIINQSRAYYNTQSSFKVRVFATHKTSIEEGYKFDTIDCLLKKQTNIQLIQFQSSPTLLYTNSAGFYAVDMQDKSFEKRKPVQESEGTVAAFGTYPFFDFDRFQKLWLAANSQIRVADSLYVVSNKMGIVTFRRKDFSVASATAFNFDPGIGANLFKNKFTELQSLTSDVDEREQKIIGIINSGNITRQKPGPVRVGEYFDYNLLSSATAQPYFKNDRLSYKEKYLFLDFFFQGCGPCYFALPALSDLHHSSDSNLVMIGIAHVQRDSVNMEAYRKKRNIEYDMILGSAAERILNAMKVKSWPTFIVVAPGGKIIEVQEGLREAFFKRVRKQFVKK